MTLKWILFGKVGTLKGRIATALGKWCESNADSFSGSTTYEFVPAQESRFQVVDEQPKRATFSEAFAVAGRPRRSPWHIRRKELEAAHKTKRKQLEEYREMM